MNKMGSLLVFYVGVFFLYLRQVAPSVTPGDSGEFMTTAATLGLAHAPAYPLFSLFGKVFINLVPLGAIGYRMNVFSAFCSSFTLVLLVILGQRLGLRRLEAMGFSLLFGVSTSFWLNSLVTEVFPLNTLFVAGLSLVWLCAIQSWDSWEAWLYTVLFVFLVGLGLGNHHILVFFIGPFLVLTIVKKFWKRGIPSVLFLFLIGFVGFSVYAFLPIRAQKGPPLNVGQPTNLSRTVRVISRKDYGTLSLALGESPERTLKNTGHHVVRFSKHMKEEVFWPLLILMIIGYGLGIKNNPPVYVGFLSLFLLAGPGFYLLANLPFSAQSEGIMGRFFILPLFALMMGLIPLASKLKKAGAFLLFFFVFLQGSSCWAEAAAHRHSRLVIDYARGLVRSLPFKSILFMDGGDDTFYSLAYWHFAENRRPDISIHDRGSVVFKGVYGNDFRRLPKGLKPARRHEIEKKYLGKRPLFYSTMADQTIPGVPMVQRGFLYEASDTHRPGFSWPLAIIRSLYPLQTKDYRTRALGPYFPFMRGKKSLNVGNWEETMRYFYRAQIMGHDVDWLHTNLMHYYVKMGYEAIQSEEYEKAEKIYRQAIQFNPHNQNVQSNLGVAYERQNKDVEARDQYAKATDLFPEAVDPPYNLAVWYWHKKDWPHVITYLEETLKRNPHHRAAQNYLFQARTRLKHEQNR